LRIQCVCTAEPSFTVDFVADFPNIDIRSEVQSAVGKTRGIRFDGFIAFHIFGIAGTQHDVRDFVQAGKQRNKISRLCIGIDNDARGGLYGKRPYGIRNGID
jgi:hypothetical protein